MITYTWLMSFAITTFILTNILPKVTSSLEADKITSLPGQPHVKFQQFAGYISIDETQKRNLFYYFVEAENNPSSKPLVLWLNGGPCCSSLGGAFTEHGPFRPSGNVLIKNRHSWNKEANILYVESPAGVGYSYSANKSFYEGVNDEITAKDNMVFLRNWLAKYPQYNNSGFFIAGESYGGHYVPQLANLVLKSSLKSHLKGIAIGNPLLEFNTDLNSRTEYLWSHGLLSDATYELTQKTCNYSQIFKERTQKRFLSPPCDLVNSQINREVGNIADTYDVYHDVCYYSPSQQGHPILNLMNEEKVDVCRGNETDKYLNRKDVQKAMNAHLVGVTRWSICSTYHMEDLEIPTLPLLRNLIKAGIRVLVYSGDQDSIIPLTGTRKLVNKLAKELDLKPTVPYRSWLADKQVGGWTQVYGDILSYTTIRGAAHQAPSTQPSRSLVLFRAFLTGKPLPEVPFGL